MESDNKNNEDSYAGYIRMIQRQYELVEDELPPTHLCGGMTEVMVPVRDGTKLNTRIYVPAGTGPWPVILERNPYPDMHPVAELAAWEWTKYGYAAVLQDCRGTGGSEGRWEPFENERNDGLDVIHWIIEQSWMNGSMAMNGQSYGGFVQWILADRLPPEVKTLFIGVFGTERHRQMYMNGMFRHEIYTFWAVQNNGAAPLADPGGVYRSMLQHVPHIEADAASIGQELPWYREWLLSPGADAAAWDVEPWSGLQAMPGLVSVPLYLFGGWFDHHLDGMMCAYEGLPDQVKSASRFVIGPWVHTLQTAGDLEMGNAESSPLREAILWFDHQLKGKPYAYSTGVVDTYVVGDDGWRAWTDWGRRDKTLKLHMDSGGSVVDGALKLMDKPGGEGRITFRYDPRKPVRTLGGDALLAWINPAFGGSRPASVLQLAPGEREDIITFVTEPFHDELAIAGAIRACLSVRSDAVDTAFTVKVSEMKGDGGAYNIRDGITTLAYRNGAGSPQDYVPGDTAGLEIELWPVAWTLSAGSRLRVDISSSNFPAYHLHSNHAGNWALQQEFRAANQTLLTGAEHNAWIEIPLG
ncbi:CocE/NonD family hydrolase [Paenibacillus sp. S150]|uniref:CocE/NonD family hydrolase n=1 Tax=Paenibacillus sp. S150 TaxID=2749826 RepID=UPI001C57E951|nr:CocE/NonD family hydrolase [Paenibacillus sp. S150]MBW4081186.1 CocE/NonD family hydrolase [Paenibacillus sp. S150]